MKESIHKYFQVGTIQWMSYPQRDPMESLKAICKDDFFDAIELKGYGDKNEEAKKLLEQSHLKVCYGAQPRLLGGKLNPNDLDEEGRKKVAAGDKGSGLCAAFKDNTGSMRLCRSKGHDGGTGGV